MTKRLLLLALIATPVVAWATVKPVRMVAPSLHGIACHGAVCVEDPERLQEAQLLYRSALVFVETALSDVRPDPRMIFCSTAECYESFGGGREKAIAYPWLGSLISPSAWKPHFVRHELIHQLQFQRLGAVQAMRAPLWLREGMAYSLSQPPLDDFPEQFRPLAREYESWVQSVVPGEIWAAAAGV